MKNTKPILTASLAAIGFLVLILDAKTAAASAQDAIALCIQTVIPALFPFFVLSSLLTGSLQQFHFPFLRPIGWLCRMPQGSEPLLLLGFLGGYPSGAQNVTQCFTAGQLSAQDARRLLGFCSNAGPAFLFGMASRLFRDVRLTWVLWGIHMTAAVLTGILLSGKSQEKTHLQSGSAVTLSQALDMALKTTARVCGWIILFRIILGYPAKWLFPFLPSAAQIILTGLTELALGCQALEGIENTGLRFIICAVILGFGGLCVLMQTLSVTGPLGLGAYIPGKLFHALLSFHLSYQAQFLLLEEAERFVLPMPVIFFLWLILFLTKIAVAIQRLLMYNPDIIQKTRSLPCFSEKISPKPAITAPTEPAMRKG